MLGVFGCPVSVSDADTCSTAARGGAAVSYAAPVMHNLPRLHGPALLSTQQEMFPGSYYLQGDIFCVPSRRNIFSR